VDYHGYVFMERSPVQCIVVSSTILPIDLHPGHTLSGITWLRHTSSVRIHWHNGCKIKKTIKKNDNKPCIYYKTYHIFNKSGGLSQYSFIWAPMAIWTLEQFIAKYFLFFSWWLPIFMYNIMDYSDRHYRLSNILLIQYLHVDFGHPNLYCKSLIQPIPNLIFTLDFPGMFELGHMQNMAQNI